LSPFASSLCVMVPASLRFERTQFGEGVFFSEPIAEQ
jgi:hypothetical protein